MQRDCLLWRNIRFEVKNKLKGNTSGHHLSVMEKSTHLLACLLQLAEARLERSHRELMGWDPCVLSSPLPPHLEGS